VLIDIPARLARSSSRRSESKFLRRYSRVGQSSKADVG
jgi:hypothetical protein